MFWSDFWGSSGVKFAVTLDIKIKMDINRAQYIKFNLMEDILGNGGAKYYPSKLCKWSVHEWKSIFPYYDTHPPILEMLPFLSFFITQWAVKTRMKWNRKIHGISRKIYIIDFLIFFVDVFLENPSNVTQIRASCEKMARWAINFKKYFKSTWSQTRLPS